MVNKSNIIVFLLLGIFHQSCSQKIDHAVIHQKIESTWTFCHADSTEYRLAQVPGSIHLDLMNSGIIEDSYLSMNELSNKWVEYQDWTYRSEFDMDPSIVDKKFQKIKFNGIDTYAEIFLNDSLIQICDNMFRTWEIDVAGILQVENNELIVKFKSPIKENKSKVESSPYPLPSGCEEEEYNVGPYTRKAPYQFGWDWGPRLVGCGIWKDIEINAYNTAEIRDIFVRTESFSEWEALLKVAVQIEHQSETDSTYKLLINNQLNEITLSKGLNDLEFEYLVKDPILWWPSGHGTAHMYEMTVELLKGDHRVDSKTERYGIKTVFLHQERDSIGTAYYFEINGERIFAKGANYIPQDLIIPRVSDHQYRYLLQQVKDANMNMIRVWGGGIYESDLFYELCDSLGIMVWQDFMFAGSLYPGDPEFVENVKAEVTDNIKRLRNHPSIVHWCGNNEIEVAYNNWGWQDKFGYSKEFNEKLWNDYSNLFEFEIPDILRKLDPQTPYSSSSPLSNWGKKENFNHSSMHYWGVWHGRDPFSSFEDNVGRFMVEYGFQSFPKAELLRKYIPESEWDLESELMKHRQKSYIGNGLIKHHTEQIFGEAVDFDDFILKSQWTQAEAMRQAIIAHRKNQGKCMGTLFWQLNDCWPGPSWSCIQYDGDEKSAYEEISNLYEPTIGILEMDKKTPIFYLITDQLIEQNVEVQFLQKEKEEWELKMSLNETLSSLEVKKIEFENSRQWKKAIDRNKDILIIILKDEDVIYSDKFYQKIENRYLVD